MLQDASLGLRNFGFKSRRCDLAVNSTRVADDFTVHDPDGWRIDTISFYFFEEGSSTTSTIGDVRLRIRDGPPDDPDSSLVFGDHSANVLAESVWSNIYRVSEASSGTDRDRPVMANTVTVGTDLGPGTYWLDWFTLGDETLSGPWVPPITINGQATTGNALVYDQTLCSIVTTFAWRPLTDGGRGQGLPFIIRGTAESDRSELSSLIFPIYANGEVEGAHAVENSEQDGRPNKTRLILKNNGNESDTGRIQFRDSSGLLTAVSIAGNSTSTLEYTLSPWASQEIETDGNGGLQTGSIEVIPHQGKRSRIEGTEIFEILGNFVSVENAIPQNTQQVYISVNSDENTGIAAYNPDEGHTATLQLRLLDSQGMPRGIPRQLELAPKQQVSRFVDEEDLFGDFFEFNPEDFSGTLNITVRERRKIAITGLIQQRASGALVGDHLGEPGD